MKAKREAVGLLLTERDFGVMRACGLVGDFSVVVSLSQPPARGFAVAHRGGCRA